MKQHRTTGLLVVLACALALSACKKEENTKTVCMKVQFERAGSQKVYIGGDGSVYWNVDDENDPSSKVLLWTDGGSPSEKTITNAGIEVPESGTYAAVFPSTGSAVNKKGGHAPIPAEQTYRKDSKGDQIVEAPMAARQTGNKGVLYFRNLGGLIRVRVTATDTMYIQRIEVTSASEALSGDMYFSFDTSTTVKAPELFGIAGNASNSVSLTFPEAEILTANTTKDYYLAAAPFDSSEISIKVTYLQDGSFLRTLTLASGNGTDRKRLGRSGLGAVDMSSVTPSGVLNSFRISDTKSVVFAPGNLQYQASTGKWRFAKHQWVSYTDTNTNTSEAGNMTAQTLNNYEHPRLTQNKWIDLFGYGTSGKFKKSGGTTTTKPCDITGGNDDYPGTNLNDTTDWGVNLIQNPAGGDDFKKNTWRTLTKAEWEYVLGINSGTRRPGATVNGTEDQYHAHTVAVNNVPGIFIFPDNAVITYGSTKATIGGYQYTIISASDFSRLEAAGVVFLPMTYSTSNNGGSIGGPGDCYTTDACYWSSTYLYRVRSNRCRNTISLDNKATRYHTQAVRLARDIPSN